jgi:hypothetical protein
MAASLLFSGRALQCPLSRPRTVRCRTHGEGQPGGQLKTRLAVSPCRKCLHTWRWPWSSKPIHCTPRYTVARATIPVCSLLNTTKSDAPHAARGGVVQVPFFLRDVRRRPGLSDAVDAPGATTGATGGNSVEQLRRLAAGEAAEPVRHRREPGDGGGATEAVAVLGRGGEVDADEVAVASHGCDLRVSRNSTGPPTTRMPRHPRSRAVPASRASPSPPR